MITIINQPPLFNYSKNPVVVKANTDQYGASGGVALWSLLVSNYTMLNGATLLLKSNLFTQRITFNQSGINTSTNIVFDSSVVNNATAAVYIAKRLRQNYYLNKYYTIKKDSPLTFHIVGLTARAFGADYSIVTTTTGSGFSIGGHVGVNPEVTDTRLLVQVFQYNSAKSLVKSALEIGSRTLVPDSEGNIEEDISDIIDDYLEYEINNAPLSLSYLITKNNNRYYITVSELGAELANDNTVNEIGILNPTTDFYVIKGGVDKMTFINPSYNLTTGFVGKTKTFLTDYPLEVDLYLDKSNIVFFVYAGNNAPTNIIITAVLEDASTSILTTPINALPAGIVYQLPITISTVNFNAIEASTGKKIINFYYEIADSVGICSERKYFNIDKKYYKNFNQLLLKNSKGAYEIFSCKGEVKINQEIDFNTLNKTLPVQYTTKDFQQDRTSPIYTTPVLMNTGHLKSKAEKKWLADLLIQGQGFRIINNMLAPIIIKNTNINTGDTTEDIYSYDIEFLYSYSNTSYNL